MAEPEKTFRGHNNLGWESDMIIKKKKSAFIYSLHSTEDWWITENL